MVIVNALFKIRGGYRAAEGDLFSSKALTFILQTPNWLPKGSANLVTQISLLKQKDVVVLALHVATLIELSKLLHYKHVSIQTALIRIQDNDYFSELLCKVYSTVMWGWEVHLLI